MKWYGVVAADSKYSPSIDPIRPSVKCGRSSRARVVPYLSMPDDGSHSARPGGSLSIVVMTSRNSA